MSEGPENENPFEEPEESPVEKIEPRKVASLAFLLFGFYFLVFAMVQFIINTYCNTYVVHLECNKQNCSIDTPSLRFTDNHPVHVYFTTPSDLKDIDIFRSYSFQQALGIYNSPTDQVRCLGAYTNQEMQKTVNLLGKPLNPSMPAFPCGKRPLMFPKGELKIFSFQSQTYVDILTENTINPYSRTIVFKNANPQLQWLNTSTPQFQNWMVQSPGGDSTKYWGVLKHTISGVYRVEFIVDDNIKVSRYTVILTDAMTEGGYNEGAWLFNLISSVVSFSFAVIAYVHKSNRNKVWSD